MKQNFSLFLLFLLAFVILGSFTTYAQETDANDAADKEIIEELKSHQELNLNEDKTLISEPELKSSPAHSAKEVPVSTKTAKPKSDKANPEKEEEDALSFNFLFYIIQKFKISDIVDE
jgi:hypothetical protein